VTITGWFWVTADTLDAIVIAQIYGSSGFRVGRAA
jgi:hypothetical protein